jgi:di/tricarboxylate transporter
MTSALIIFVATYLGVALGRIPGLMLDRTGIAFLANDIVCLAFTPVLTLSLLSGRRNPVPYLLGLAIASNIGSAATIIGNPQNMLIGQVGRLAFGRFFFWCAPPAAAALLIGYRVGIPVTIVSLIVLAAWIAL